MALVLGASVEEVLVQIEQKDESPRGMNCSVPPPLPGTCGLLPLRSSAWTSGGS